MRRLSDLLPWLRRAPQPSTASPVAAFEPPVASGPPVFVRALSRSGGTLAATLLDAHPDLAMSYELYPNLLETQDGSPQAIRELADRIDAARDLTRAGKAIEERGLRIYVHRCARSGIDNHQLAEILRQHAEEDDLASPQGRLRFMERCCLVKMGLEGKHRWGLKCTNSFDEYLAMWPDAYLINMVRDGRDVLASQQNTGSFTTTPSQLGASWSKLHLRFRELVEEDGVNALEVGYERLVRDPESEVRRIAEHVGVDFEPRMLDFHRADLTIYSSSHVSMERISKPIDDSMVGRWRKDLSPESLEAFYAEASAAMQALGYGVERLPDIRRARLLDDFLASTDLTGAYVADICPADYEFARYALSRGAQGVVIFGDRAVLGDGYPRGVEVRPLAELCASGAPHVRFDGVFALGLPNALAATEADGRRSQVETLAALVRPFGWCLVAPSNAPPVDVDLDERHADQALDEQAETFADHGFAGFELDPELADTYGLREHATNRRVFARNLLLPKPVTRCRRVAVEKPMAPPLARPAAQASPQTTSTLDRGEINEGGPLPLDFYLGFLDFLARHRDQVQVITYQDLPWGEDTDYQGNYPHEHRAWKRWLAADPKRMQRAYVLLQHDVDLIPERSMSVARESAHRGLPANLLVFNRRVDRQQLRNTGMLGFTDYPLDTSLLQRLEQRHGFVVGYHSNAMEQGLWDEVAALEHFCNDLTELRTRYNVRFFSPHGGVRGPFSANNTSLQLPRDLSRDVRWVANRYSPRFTATYSDGGLNNLTQLHQKDLRAFVCTWRPGCRYRVLTHPQYYASGAAPRERLLAAEWYAELFDSGPHGARALWEDMRLPFAHRAGRTTRR